MREKPPIRRVRVSGMETKASQADSVGEPGLGTFEMRSLVILFCLALVQPAFGSETRGLGAKFQKPITGETLDLKLFDEAVTAYANAARKAHGATPLKQDKRLHLAAAAHAHNMAQLRTHSHRLPVAGEGRLSQRMARNGVRFRTAGENIGMEKVLRLLGRPIAMRSEGCNFTYADTGGPVPVHTYDSLAKSAVARWMASPKHRASLLSENFSRVGHGFAIDRSGPACGDVYLAQTFAG